MRKILMNLMEHEFTPAGLFTLLMVTTHILFIILVLVMTFVLEFEAVCEH